MDIFGRSGKRILRTNSLQSSPISLVRHEDVQELTPTELKEFSNIPHPMTLNNTRKAQADLIIFSRVPKVGSEMLVEMMRLLGKRNNFSVFRNSPGLSEKVILSESQQIDLSGVLSGLPQPATYTQHLSYIDFAKYNHPKPIYINLVRNPVDRIISWFYYSRVAWKYKLRQLKFPDEPLPELEFLKKDFETCVMENDLECSFVEGSTYMGKDHRRQMLFFCGSDPDCRPFNSQELFDKAKDRLENEYAVVGLLEDLNTTLTVFEKYIPKFFAGATELYYSNYEKFKKINRNNFRPLIRDEIKEMLKKNLSREFEFYELCKERLKLQFLAAEIFS